VAEDGCHFGDGGASGVEYGILIAAVAEVIVVLLYLFGGLWQTTTRRRETNSSTKSLFWTVHRSFSAD
jgi:hypothetical protein